MLIGFVLIFHSLLQTHEKILGENLSEPILLLAAAVCLTGLNTAGWI